MTSDPKFNLMTLMYDRYGYADGLLVGIFTRVATKSVLLRGYLSEQRVY